MDAVGGAGFALAGSGAIREHGLTTRPTEDGTVLDVDFGVDWREHPVALLDLGPVLARSDAVANKVGALYSRAEARDFLDVDAIRRAGAYTDEQLLDLAEGHDAGFDRLRFARQLAQVMRLSPKLVAQYGVDEIALAGVRARLAAWSRELLTPPA